MNPNRMLYLPKPREKFIINFFNQNAKKVPSTDLPYHIQPSTEKVSTYTNIIRNSFREGDKASRHLPCNQIHFRATSHTWHILAVQTTLASGVSSRSISQLSGTTPRRCYCYLQPTHGVTCTTTTRLQVLGDCSGPRRAGWARRARDECIMEGRRCARIRYGPGNCQSFRRITVEIRESLPGRPA